MKPFRNNKIPALLCAAAMTVALPMSTLAVESDPAFTGEMNDPDYWASRYSEPLTPLASTGDLVSLNEASRSTRGTLLRDLSVWSETDYNGVTWARELRENALELADHIYNDCDGRYDAEGRFYKRWTDAKELFAPMIENCYDTDTTVGEHELYAICTTAGYLHSFPSDTAILTRDGGEGVNYQHRSEVLLGEPLILKGESEDGEYVYAYSGGDSGWMAWEDLAVCHDRDEWLRAWQFSEESTLVVYGDGVRTASMEDSWKSSDQSLHMGTLLRLAELEDYQDQLSFDSARGEYVVWMPLRSEDGWYAPQLAVVERSSDVNQGYLPLNTANLAAVALKQPKSVYRWSDYDGFTDCCGYARRVYRCFGLDLAGSIGALKKQPLRQVNLKGMSDGEKTEILKNLPMGTLLRVKGKELFYLGHVGERLYVISCADAQAEGTDELHSTVMDTMDTLLSDGTSLLNNLNLAVVPYYNAEPNSLEGAEVTGLESAVYTGKEICQAPTVVVDGVELQEGVHYTLSWENNVKAGKALVVVTGKGNWTGSVKKSFIIRPAATRLTGLTGAEGSMSVRWKKKAGVKGYQLQYSTQMDFSDAVKLTVKGRKKKAKTISGLPSGSTCYVRIRTYVKAGGKTAVSPWSEAMSVTIE